MINKSLLEKLKSITAEEERILGGELNIDKSIYMDKPGDVISSRKMLPAGKLIDVRPHTRFVCFPKHTHDFVEIVYMCSGSTTHIVNGNKIILKEGELLLLCQGATQEIMAAELEDVAVNFIILPEFFDEMLKMMGEEDTPLRKFIVDCLKNNRANTGYLHFQVADVLPVQNLIENLILTLTDDISYKRSINQLTMGLIFIHLLNSADRLVSQAEDERVIVKVLGYIEESYKSGSLNKLAEILHYDVSTLSRMIKKETGKNYTDLIQEKRLSQACYLIKNTDMNIDEASLTFSAIFAGTYPR